MSEPLGEFVHLPEYPFDLHSEARFAGIRAAMDYLAHENVRVTAIQVDETVARFFQHYRLRHPEHFGRSEG